MTNSNDGGSSQKAPERSAASNDDQPDTAAHTITGAGTIPTDATVVTRDSEIAKTVRDDADSHACEGCGQTFDEIGQLLDHDCDEDWDGPDPDDDTPTAFADGGVDRIETAEEFLEWSFEIRGEDCLVVTNDLSGNDDRPNRAAVWSEEPIDVPEGVVVETEKEAEGTAPAVQDRDVEGWTKYELRLAKQALADGGEVAGISPDVLEERKRQWSTTDQDEQDRCEECGSVCLEPKNPTDVDSKREHPERYRCGNCGAHVDGSGGDA